jgi:hypothetical protein
MLEKGEGRREKSGWRWAKSRVERARDFAPQAARLASRNPMQRIPGVSSNFKMTVQDAAHLFGNGVN